MKNLSLFLWLGLVSGIYAENLVPNGSFENTDTYTPVVTPLNCLSNWRNFSGILNPDMRTPDLCDASNPGFFPPMSIAPYDGQKYVAMDCGITNPEYVQVRLSSPLEAGATYCVSFYISAYNQFNTFAQVGAYFSGTPQLINPTVAGLNAQVSTGIIADPAQWQLAGGTYVATGGEEYMTLGGFQYGMPLFAYTYIDFVSVYKIEPQDLLQDAIICAGEDVLLDAGNDASAYLWNTGETTSSIMVSAPGTYTVEKMYGNCSYTYDAIITSEGCENPWVEPGTTLYIPNAYTPNGDGLNDIFGAAGTNVKEYRMTVFDRWGMEVFSTKSIAAGWNGMYQENLAPEGVYVYSISYKSKNKSAVSYATGHVLLLR